MAAQGEGRVGLDAEPLVEPQFPELIGEIDLVLVEEFLEASEGAGDQVDELFGHLHCSVVKPRVFSVRRKMERKNVYTDSTVMLKKGLEEKLVWKTASASMNSSSFRFIWSGESSNWVLTKV